MSAATGAVFEDRPAAKVNLTLRVLGRRPDGFHDLRSTMLRIGLTDRLRACLGGADGSDVLTAVGLPDVSSRDNLVMRAVAAVRAKVGAELPALDLSLVKNIPVAAGLGGGSSDCVSAIKLAQACWGIGMSSTEEMALGAELGSDVPFFLSGAAAAEVAGRGERVERIDGPPDGTGVLLVTPRVPLSTARVFARYDDLEPGGSASSAGDLSPLSLASLGGEIERLRDANDLWPAAASLEPSLSALRGELEGASGRPWMLSGSGPTLFTIYPASEEAAEAGRSLSRGLATLPTGAAIQAVDLMGPDPIWRNS